AGRQNPRGGVTPVLGRVEPAPRPPGHTPLKGYRPARLRAAGARDALPCSGALLFTVPGTRPGAVGGRGDLALRVAARRTLPGHVAGGHPDDLLECAAERRTASDEDRRGVGGWLPGLIF